jgi:proteic killer suppression protein
VIVSIRDGGTKDVYDGKNSRDARRSCPDNILSVARRKLDMIQQAVRLDDLRAPPGNRLEKLSGSLAGQYSIRIEDQYRICFGWAEAGATEVEITDYH